MNRIMNDIEKPL